MPDTLALVVTASSSAAVDKTLALAETYLKPEAAASLKDHLKGIRLKRASLEADVDVSGAGPLSVSLSVAVTPPG